jgi:hypothetical protein
VKEADGAERIGHRIERYIFFAAGPPGFPVAPFRLKFLDVRTVAQHDVAQVVRGERGDDLSLKAVLVQDGEPSGMVDVRMRQKNEVNQMVRDGNILIHIDVLSLFHTAVNENVFSAGFQIVAASGHFVVGAYKSKFHIIPPL